MDMPYRSLLEALALDSDPIVADVVADVGRPDEDPAVVEALVRPAVESLLAGLAGATELPEAARARFRREGADAARLGEGVAAPIDRYLSAGWAIWDAATRRGDVDRGALAALGAALLRAGDTVAAAIAEGHGEAERELARRAGAARRAFADDLLDLAPGDRDGLARLARRAMAFGVDPAARFVVLAAWLGRELEDADREAEWIERAAARPGRPTALPIATSRHGRLVLALPEGGSVAPTAASLLAELAEGASWSAVRSPAAEGLGAVAVAAADALAALAIVERVGPTGRIVDADDVELERALLADRRRIAAAVDRELGRLMRAPRVGPELVETLSAYLDTRQNLRATARTLGVAPRTVTYRLERIESLLGRRLDGPALRRIATALLARDLLEATA